MHKPLAYLSAVVAGSALALATTTVALAHEVRPVGAYVLTVGWKSEPTYVGVENSVQVFVHDHAGNAVADLNDGDMKVAVITGSQTSGTMDLKNGYDSDTGLGIKGEYDAALIPTAPGTYTFHITGAIRGQSIDQKFTSSDSTFDDVKDPTDIEFPSHQPTQTELGQLTTKLQTREQALSTTQTQLQADLTKAQNAANQDLIIAIVAGVIGLVGVILAVVLPRRRAV